MKPRILHLSADYPDHYQLAKTRAISGLIGGTGDIFEHRVVSLNRSEGFNGYIRQGHVLEYRRSKSILAIRYAAPPAPVAVSWAMSRLAAFIERELSLWDFTPDLIQGHKLTIEGILAKELSQRLGIPYVLTLQGNTDQKLLTQRPDRRPAISCVWREARAIMAFAPWTASWCVASLDQPRRPITIIPCLLPRDEILPPVECDMLVRTAFNLDFWSNKNLVGLLAAVALLAPRFPAIQLEIAGSGSARACAEVERRIAASGVADRVTLVGAVPTEAIQAWFNQSAAFALASHRESFGMVFAEALLAGTPVVHPRGAAIDGFFRDQTFARPAAANDPQELADAIAALLVAQAEVKSALADAQRAGKLNLFRRNHILSSYTDFLEEALT